MNAQQLLLIKLITKLKSIFYLVCQSQIILKRKPLKTVKTYLIDAILGVYGKEQPFPPLLRS